MEVKGMHLAAEITFRKDYTFSLFVNKENTIGKVIGFDYDFNGVDSQYIFETPEMEYWQAKNLWEMIEFGINVYYGHVPTYQEFQNSL